MEVSSPHATPHGQKRQPDDDLEHDQRLAKRFNLLNLGMIDPILHRWLLTLRRKECQQSIHSRQVRSSYKRATLAPKTTTKQRRERVYAR